MQPDVSGSGSCVVGREGVRREEVLCHRRKVASSLDCWCKNRMVSISVNERLASHVVGNEDTLYRPFGG